MPEAQFNEFVANARSSYEHGSKQVQAVLDMRDPCLRFPGNNSFWQLLFNQIQMTKRAQFSPNNQVEVGKTVVVEEISRTFLVYQTLNFEQDQIMKTMIPEALKKVEQMAEDAVASIFSVIPEANLPVISMG